MICLLVFFGGGAGSGVTSNMKHETGISGKPAVSLKCCHMPTFLCKKYQTKSSLQVHTAKYCAAIQSWRTLLTVVMGWCSLIISWLAHLMSMHIVTSPSGLGATTSGETQLVGPSGTVAKCDSITLNDVIHAGPKLQRELLDVFFPFHRNPVALVCDIPEMCL